MLCNIGEEGSWLLSPPTAPTAPTAANCFSCNTYLFASLLTYLLLYLLITIVALLITRGGAVGGTATWVPASLLTYYYFYCNTYLLVAANCSNCPNCRESCNRCATELQQSCNRGVVCAPTAPTAANHMQMLSLAENANEGQLSYH